MIFSKEERNFIIGLILFSSFVIDMRILLFSTLFYITIYLTIKYKKYGMEYFIGKKNIVKYYFLHPTKLLEVGTKIF